MLIKKLKSFLFFSLISRKTPILLNRYSSTSISMHGRLCQQEEELYIQTENVTLDEDCVKPFNMNQLSLRIREVLDS
jgi:hypothetical protein